MSDRQTDFDLSYQRQPDESDVAWKARIARALGMFPEGHPEFEEGVDSWTADDRIFVDAWDGQRTLPMIIPPVERRSISENQRAIPPYELRDENDEWVGERELYATFDQAYLNARALALKAGGAIQIINAFGNTCGAADWEELPR